MVKRTDVIMRPDARVLVLSKRKLHQHVANSCLFEFEDMIAEMDAADLFLPEYPYDFSIEVFKWVKRFTRSRWLANAVRPDPNRLTLDRDYDLFFTILANPMDVFQIDSARPWRRRCQRAACYVIEAWQSCIEQGWKPLLEFLKEFDHIFLGVHHSVDLVAEITGRPCSYLPPAVDAIKFCPYPVLPPRSIDITYIGRRSAITHQALLQLAEQGKLHYYYDTAQGEIFNVPHPQEHRSLLANLLKRTRYFVTNLANVDQPEKTGSIQEIGYRFMEGAAAGTVMIGVPPATEVFQRHFDWEDAVIPIPFHVPDIGAVLAELDTQPERLETIRRNNSVNALLRHDWLYRWQQVLTTLGLEPTAEMQARSAQLQNLAAAYGDGVAVQPRGVASLNGMSRDGQGRLSASANLLV